MSFPEAGLTGQQILLRTFAFRPFSPVTSQAELRRSLDQMNRKQFIKVLVNAHPALYNGASDVVVV